VHVTITRVTTGEQPLGNAAIVAEEMTGWLREMEGFRGMLFLTREGETLGLSFWASKEDAERQGAVRAEFVERMAAVAQVTIVDRLVGGASSNWR
jgi:heme-degrading monooxygenase HmoA